MCRKLLSNRLVLGTCMSLSDDFYHAKCGLRCRKMSIRLSVCLSVTRHYSVKMAQHIIKLFFTFD